jgi:uncharacterized protein (DUF58 family)
VALIANLRQRLFRWQSDGSAPTRLGQRRVFILPAGSGLLYAIALVVMLIGAINYTLALGHALVFLLAGIGLTGMVHTFRNLHGLTIAPGRCEPVFAGETAHFQLILSNDRTTPRLALELEAEPGAAIRADIPAGEIVRINVPLIARRRGWLALPRVRLWSVYPLGLFRAWSYLQPEMRCLVYPAPLASPCPSARHHWPAANRAVKVARRISPASATASRPTHRATWPGRPAPAIPTGRCWSSSSPVAPRANCDSTGS